jgi:hypothetical protein
MIAVLGIMLVVGISYLLSDLEERNRKNKK